MKGDHLSIGQMAEINHTTIPTLRLYDQMGLLKPSQVDAESGYRYYDVRQNARLDMIQYMKELGMQLKEIKGILDREDVKEIESVLSRKEELVQQRIEELTIQKEAIVRTIDGIERYRKSPKPGTLTLEYIPRRLIYSIHTDINFYDHGIDTYEMLLKRLKSDLISNHLPQIYYCNAGTIMRREDFESLCFRSDTVFVFADSHFPRKDAAVALEDGTYACIYADSFDSEKECAQRLLEYCKSNGYRVSGDYLCEVLMEFDAFGKAERSMFLRLQVPVEFQK